MPPRDSPAADLGRIAAQLERGQEDRREMREELKQISAEFQNMRSVFDRMTETLNTIDRRAVSLENIVGGDKGLRDRIMLIEATQVANSAALKDHQDFIDKVKGAAWKVALAIGGSALSGWFGGEMLHRLLGIA